MNADELLTFEPEYREVIILLCPDCPHEYEESYSAIKSGSINKCPQCGFTWIVE